MGYLANFNRAAFVALLSLAATGLCAADEFASAWSRGAKSRARLIASGGIENGQYRIGLEIVLNAQALTYWRTPGEAGVPPTFKFEASKNFKSAAVLYPAPGRFLEGGATAFGYRDRVIFPIDIKPADPSRPMTVDLDLNYAVCENICIPAEARVKLDLRPDAKRAPEAEEIARFAARVPKPLPADAKPVFNMWGVADAVKPTWRVKFPASTPDADLFAEGPDGWYFDTIRAGESTYDIVLAEKPASAQLPVDGVMLTITQGEQAFETTTRLDAVARKP